MAQFSNCPNLSPMFQKAFDYAFKMHSSQVRKNGEPYLSHLLEVSSLCLKANMGEKTAIIALLHDVIEDQLNNPGSPNCLIGNKGNLGDAIYHLAVTQNFGWITAWSIDWLSAESDDEYLNKMTEVSTRLSTETEIYHGDRKDILTVSAADKLDNLKDYYLNGFILSAEKLAFHRELMSIYENQSFIPEWWIERMRFYWCQLAATHLKYH